MRVESSVTSISWIPSEAITGMTKMPFEMGMAHYDPPPPDVIPPEACYLGWQESLALLAKLVEPEIPD